MSTAETLLIGGAGFVGRALCRRLLATGQRITVLSRRENPFDASPNLQYVQSGIDGSVVRELVAKCSTLIYLASETVPGQTARAPAMEIERNLVPTVHVIEALEGCEGKQVVYLSSGGTVYGNPAATPVPESAPLQPVSYHGAAKVAAEGLWRALSSHTAHDITILRPSNLYGPDQPYQPHFGAIRKLLQHAREGRPFEIWGDGAQTRDYLFIEDFVDACLSVLTRRGKPGSLSVFNVGAGRGLRLLDLCRQIENRTGKSIPIRHLPPRTSDVMHIVLDSTALCEATGWRPSTSIELGLDRTWSWLQATS